jgi:general secretion pathway protein I
MNLKTATLNIKQSSTLKTMQGFTLVEVMIALLIVATALPALMTLIMAQVDGTSHIREKTYAMWIAENQLTRLNLLNNKSHFPTHKIAEKDSGRVSMMGLQWEWSYDTSSDERVPFLRRIDIGVTATGLSDGRGFQGSKTVGKLDPLGSLTVYFGPEETTP